MPTVRRPGLLGLVLAIMVMLLWSGQTVAVEYIIGADDVLRVSFWQQPDLNTVTRVRQDGRISLPILGEIEAAGLTSSQLEDQIVKGISIFNREISQARVEVLEFHSQKVFVTGEVYRPGKYTFEYIPNLWEVIREAGGPREGAALTEVAIIRAQQEGGEKFTVNLSAALESGDFSKIPPLKAGDTVIVPRLAGESVATAMDILGRSVVYLYGQIARPGVYPIEENSTLLEAITQAGGPTEEADMKNVRVLMKQDNGSTVAKVNVDQYIHKGTPPDLPLHAGDMVVIPKKSGVWRSAWKGMTQVVGVTSGVLGIIYIVDWLAD